MENYRDSAGSIDEGLMDAPTGETYQDLEKASLWGKYTSPKRLIGRLGGLAAAALISAASMMPYVSYAADPDRDGLSTIYENSIGTDPNLADTDGDGFNDGIEDANPINDGDPNNFDAPGLGNQMYQLDNQTELMSVDTLNHRLMPALSHSGKSLAVVRTDLSYENASIIYVLDIATPTEVSLTDLNYFEFGHMSFGPDDNFVYFSDSSDGGTTINLFRYNLKSPSLEQLTTLPAGQQIYDPFVVRFPNSSSLTNKDWLFVGTTDVNGSSNTEITAYPFVSGVLDFNSPVAVADMEVVGLVGVEGAPKLSVDGKVMLFEDEISNTDIKTFTLNGIEDILLGVGPGEVTNPGIDPRADYAGFSSFLTIPIGVTPTGSNVLVSLDQNQIYDTGLRNFDQADFDIFIIAMNSTGSSVVSRSRIPMERNQYSGGVVDDGTQVVYSSDNDFTSDTNHNIFIAEVNSLSRVAWWEEGNVVATDWSIIDLSGVKLSLLDGTTFDLPGVTPNGMIKITSQALTDRVATDGIEVVRRFEPTGFIIDPSSLFYSYLDSDVDNLKISEEDLKIYEYNELTGEYDKEQTIVSRDTVNNILEVEITGFSNFGMRGVSDPDNVYVDFNNAENVAGTQSNPLNNLADAVTLSNPGATIRIKSGTSSETGVFRKPLTIMKQGGGGNAIIGVSARSASRANEDESQSGFVSRQRD